MSRKNNKRNTAKRRNRIITISIWRFLKRTQIREKIIKANAWADCHRKKTVFITISTLTFFLIVGILSTFNVKEQKENNLMGEIEDVQAVVQSFQQIQNVNDYHTKEVSSIILQGKSIKNELDSLINIKKKNRQDSINILIKYKQLQIIANNFKNE
ncbi:MAG: hypothetical protein J5918_07400 [Prevotella sp.]|nr:hypothetical protein [Prevotella sp.]